MESEGLQISEKSPISDNPFGNHSGISMDAQNTNQDDNVMKETAKLLKDLPASEKNGILLQRNRNLISPDQVFNQIKFDQLDEEQIDPSYLLDQLIVETNSLNQTDAQKELVQKKINEWIKNPPKKKAVDQDKKVKDPQNGDNHSNKKSITDETFANQKITPEWILKNQGHENIAQIIEDQFVERMFQYDINKQYIGDQIQPNTSYEIIYSGNQVHYGIKHFDEEEKRLSLSLYSPGKDNDENYVVLTNLNMDAAFTQNCKLNQSLVSFQQCGEYIYYFLTGEPPSQNSSVMETQITDNSISHSNPFSPKKQQFSPKGKQEVVKTNFELIRYHVPSGYKESCHVYEAPYKFNQDGVQLVPLSVLFIKEQTAVSGLSRQNWPPNIDGSNCQKFLDSLLVGITYHEPYDSSYKISIRSLNPNQFQKNELFFTPKSFPLQSHLDLMIAKKASNPNLPNNQVILIYVDNRGQYALSTESMLCITSGSNAGFGQGAQIGMCVSKLNNLKAFGSGNAKVGDYLNKVAGNTLNYPKNLLQILEKNGNLLNIRNQKSLSKICALIGKLLSMDNQNGKSTQFKALYDMNQETLIITHLNTQYIFAKGILENAKLDILTHSQQLNQFGFIPPHVKAIFHDRDVTFDGGFVQLSYQFSNLARDKEQLFLVRHDDLFDLGKTSLFKIDDHSHKLSCLQNPILCQSKKKGVDTQTLFDSAQNNFSSSKVILQKFQFVWEEENQQFVVQRGRAGDLSENRCEIKTESVIFQEDERSSRPLIVLNGKHGVWVVILDFKNEKIIGQMQIYLNQGDLKQINYNSIYLAQTSEIEFKKDGEFEQGYQVCVAIGDYQINLYEFKMILTQDFWTKSFKSSIEMVGEKRMYFKNPNILKFFGPFFKQNYEIKGSQLVLENDDKVRILNIANKTQYQYSNKFGKFGCKNQGSIWLGEVKYSGEILKYSGIQQQEVMKVGDLIIDGLLRTSPFCIKEYLLKDNWLEGPTFFENMEILNGNSPANFCLDDQRYFKSKMKARSQKHQIDFGPFQDEKFDPLFQKSVHLSSFLEFTQKFGKTQEMLLECMFSNEIDLNDPINSVLVENIQLVFHTKNGLIPSGKLDLAPLNFKSKVNKFTSNFNSDSLTSYSLAKCVNQVNLGDLFGEETNMPMLIIDKQWQVATRFYSWINIVVYAFGYFMPLILHINADSNDNYEPSAPMSPLIVSLYFMIIAVNGILKMNFQPIYFADIVMFGMFYVYYIKRFSKENFQEYYEGIEDEDMFNMLGYRAMKSYLIIHAMCKLAALFRIVEQFRIIIDAVYISFVGLIPISCMLILAIEIISQIDMLYIDGKSQTDTEINVIQDWFKLQPMYDVAGKSYLYLTIYYFGQVIFPIVFLNMVIAVIFERYDNAVSKNNELRYQARSAINLEFYSLLQSSLLLKALAHIDFQSQSQESQKGGKDHTDVQGIAQSVKSYIHNENDLLRKQLSYLTEKIESVDQRLNTSLGEQFPVFEKNINTKSNIMTHDIKKLEGLVQKLVDEQTKEESKTEDTPYPARSSWLGYMGGSSRKPKHQTPLKEAKDGENLRTRNVTPIREGRFV